MKKLFYHCLTLVILFGNQVDAQEGDSTSLSKEKKFSDFFVDLSVPDLAISGLMDISSDNVLKPSNFTEMAWQVYNDIENLSGTGYGVDLPLVKKENRNLNYYQEHTRRMNTRFSAGVRNSEEGLSLALGFKYNFWNGGDPYADTEFTKQISSLLYNQLISTAELASSYRTAFQPINQKIEDLGDDSQGVRDAIYQHYRIGATNEVSIEKKDKLWKKIKGSGISYKELMALHVAFNAKFLEDKKTDEEKKTKLKELKEQFSANNWNASFMTMTNGILLNADDNRVTSIKPRKWQSVWALGTPVFGTASQFIVNAQFTGNIEGTTLATDPGSDPELDQRNKLFLGGRWLLKTNKKNKLVTGNLFLEGGYTETSFYSRDLEKMFVGLIGAEFRLFEKLWIQGGIGISNDPGEFRFSLKQNIGEKSRF